MVRVQGLGFLGVTATCSLEKMKAPVAPGSLTRARVDGINPALP